MRAARLYGPGDVRVEEVPEPATRPGTVKVEVEWCGICGTDLHEYLEGPNFAPPATTPTRSSAKRSRSPSVTNSPVSWSSWGRIRAARAPSARYLWFVFTRSPTDRPGVRPQAAVGSVDHSGIESLSACGRHRFDAPGFSVGDVQPGAVGFPFWMRKGRIRLGSDWCSGVPGVS